MNPTGYGSARARNLGNTFPYNSGGVFRAMGDTIQVLVPGVLALSIYMPLSMLILMPMLLMPNAMPCL